ncbi:MAG TPA: tetratricopeptide repeat protein, partial [Chloroflexota bacterium]|nr:tetratricopeptide repeat protein [Chloroflexota bacterium]
ARLAMAASRFWRIQGHFVEGRLWLETALTSEQLTDEMRGRLLYRAGSLAQRQSDFDASRRLQTSGLRVSKAAGDRENVANCLNGLAVLALSQGDDDQASRYFLESRVEYEAVNDTWGVAACLLNLGNIALGTNQHEEAFRLYTESLQQYRGLGDAALVALCVTCLAGLALGKGEYEEAAVLAAEGLELQPESGDKLEIAYGRRLLGVARGHLGDIGDAIRLVGGAIEACHELGSIDQTIDALREMGGLAALAGNPDGAARLWGAVEALAAGSGLTIDQSDQDRYEYRLVEARGRVDRQTWDTMWRLGQALTLDEAVELALQSCE